MWGLCYISLPSIQQHMSWEYCEKSRTHERMRGHGWNERRGGFLWVMVRDTWKCDHTYGRGERGVIVAFPVGRKVMWYVITLDGGKRSTTTTKAKEKRGEKEEKETGSEKKNKTENRWEKWLGVEKRIDNEKKVEKNLKKDDLNLEKKKESGE